MNDETRDNLIEQSLGRLIRAAGDASSEPPPAMVNAVLAEVRRQRLRMMWKRCGAWAIVAAVLLVAVTLVGRPEGGRFKLASPATPLAPIASARGSAPQTVARAAPQVDAELSSLTRDVLWQLPAPADVDALRYATWRDQRRPFALALDTKTTRKLQPDHAPDYIDTLMVSGDVGQFHYDPKLPPDQSLAKLEPAAIVRLARYYGVNAREMLRAVGMRDSTSIPTLPVQNPTLGEQYADALRRWHDALMTVKQDGSEDYRSLIVFSLNASQFLSNTRTAAYLWARTFPQRARRLLADSSYVAVLPTPPAAPDYDAWLTQLRKEAVAARSCEQVAWEWSLMPAGNGCTPRPQMVEQQRKLASLVAELLPASRDGRRN